MTREEKCELAIERGYTYNPETGEICNRYNKLLKAKNNNGYIRIFLSNNNKSFGLLGHHFSWYSIYGNCDIEQIDHINGIRNDNRIINLRNVTNQQNQWNRTKAKGYSWNKSLNKWQAQIRLNGKVIYLGYFTTEEEARDAYFAAKEKMHII